MPAARSPRRRQTRYFVLRVEGREPEIARISARGSSAVYEPESGSWLNDPLLAAEIRMTGEWVEASIDELPDGAGILPTHRQGETSRHRRSRWGGRA